MRLIAVLLVLILAPLSHADYSWSNHSLVNGCNIHQMDGKLKKSFPGIICQFMDDGSFFTVSTNSLKHISKSSEVLWQINGHFHHQLNFSVDRSKILALSSEFIPKEKEVLRVDKFMLISLDGKVLHQQLSSELLKGVGLEGNFWRTNDKKIEFPYQLELTHFNSFYEIPKISSKAPDYIKQGNFVVNSLVSGTFILTSDLSRVLYHRKFKSSLSHLVHDVQVLSNGHFLFFNNLIVGSSHLQNASAIQEMVPATEKIIFEFTAQPKSLFYSRYCGSVQTLDQEHLLFTHHLNGTYILSRKSGKMISSIEKTHIGNERFIPTPSQQVKAVDLNLFLNHWK